MPMMSLIVKRSTNWAPSMCNPLQPAALYRRLSVSRLLEVPGGLEK